MTVRRRSDDYFDAAPSVVASAVRMVLSRHPPFVQTIETEHDAVFKTNVKPKWWLLGTVMTVHLQPSAGGTEVVVKTKSQFFILGDVFNFYNRYVRDFLRDLRIEVPGQTA
jgi:hypothetical protein